MSAPEPIIASQGVAPAAPAPAAPPPGAPSAPEWHGGYADGDYLKAKGWANPKDVIESYRNLEQVQRNPGQFVRLPKDENDEEGRTQLYSKLGRPDGPEGYKLEGYEPPAPETGAVDLAPAFRVWAHKRGLSQQQFTGLFEDFTAEQQRLEQANVAERNRSIEVEEQQLRSEWGPAWEENAAAINAFAARFGVTREDVNEIEAVKGYGWTMRFMARAGRALGEHQAPQPGDATPYGMTPDAAASKIKALQADKAFFQKMNDGDPAAKREWSELHRIANPEPMPQRA